MLLSIIVPCYDEGGSLPLFYAAVDPVTRQIREERGIETEFIFIDDGSRDNTLAIIKDLQAKDFRVHYVSFSRNFGKEAGLFAGLSRAKGELVTVMDADLQDPPDLLPQMLEGILDEGYDCVGTRRVTRKGEPPIRSWFSRLFYRLMRRISPDVQLVDGARDYRLMTRRMVDAVLTMPEYTRFSKGIFVWVGFETKWLEYENIARVAGETKWSFWNLLLYSIEGIVSFSTVPLSLSLFIGLLICVVAVVLMLVMAVVSPSLLATIGCILLLNGGIILLGIGVLGLYLARTYLEVKRRPLFVVREEA